MVNVTIENNITQIKNRIAHETKRFFQEHKNFPKRIRARVERHAKIVVWKTVYRVYRPKVYHRTMRFYNSIVATIPPGVDNELWIESLPSVAPSKGDSGESYGQYIAGEGDGGSIGFLYYINDKLPMGARFPRRFHHSIISESSGIFKNLEEDLERLYDKQVLVTLK